jgi:hypothetical protein
MEFSFKISVGGLGGVAQAIEHLPSKLKTLYQFVKTKKSVGTLKKIQELNHPIYKLLDL